MVKTNVPNESKKERFLRLAASRTQAIIDKIRVLENCSNTQIYDYSNDDVEKMFKSIDRALKLAKIKFHKNEKIKFGFDEK